MKALNNRKNEQGLSMIAALIIVIMIVLIGMFAIKVAPTYMENYAIKEVLLNMKQDRSVLDYSSAKLKSGFLQRLTTSSIYSLKAENVKVTSSGVNKKLHVYYQVKKPLIYNMDVLMTFEEIVEFNAR